MENKSFYQIATEAFEYLNPYEKARFLDARLDWASCGALCDELKQRLCYKPASAES